MRFEIGKKYKFAHVNGIRDEIRGKYFTPVAISEERMLIRIFNDDGTILMGPNGGGAWSADSPTSERWKIFLSTAWGSSVLEFKFV